MHCWPGPPWMAGGRQLSWLMAVASDALLGHSPGVPGQEGGARAPPQRQWLLGGRQIGAEICEINLFRCLLSSSGNTRAG
jgi:hypothetical protein